MIVFHKPLPRSLLPMDDFIAKALIMGCVFSFLAAPLGSVMVWRQLAFLGDTISHSTLLGLVLAILWEGPVLAFLIVLCIGTSVSLSLLPARSRVSVDTVLALLSQGSLALGVVLISLLKKPALNLESLLFGDILSITWEEIILTLMTACLVLGGMYFYRRPLLLTLVSEEIAYSEKVPVKTVRASFAIALGLAIGLLLKIVGVLLMTAMLIIPATTARYLSRSPAQMIGRSILFSLLYFTGGIVMSYFWDTPTGPTIVVVGILGILLVRGGTLLKEGLRHF